MASNSASTASEDCTYVELVNGILTHTSGKAKNAAQIRLKLSCDLSQPGYGLPPSFASDMNTLFSISSKALRLEVQLDFSHDSTDGVTTWDLANWVRGMVKMSLGVQFEFACEVYLALTDATHLYQATNDDLVAMGEEADGVDDPVMVILRNKGRLVQVGATGI